ncbi:hypothetical protein FOZ63_007404, partial [Perkinsus olseni]
IPKEPKVMFRSTDVPRVYESAAAFAWGMFPELTNEDPADVMDITVVDERSDSMKPSDTVCPGLEEALDEFYKSAEAKERAEWGSSLREIIGKTTGYSPIYRTDDPKQMYNLYTFPTECWVAHACPTVPSSPKAVPPEFDEGLMRSIQGEAAYWVNNRYSTSSKLRRLAYGPFIEDLLEDLREDRRRLSVYMGHDFGPANSVMDPLRLTWMDSGNRCASILPPFGAMLMMEIYTDKKVRFIYNGRVASVENIKECSGKALCSYEAIVQFLKSLVPSKRECR